MTTKVTVEACCDPKTTQVFVFVTDESNITDSEDTYLEAGEKAEFYVYDNRNITVREVPKEVG